MDPPGLLALGSAADDQSADRPGATTTMPAVEFPVRRANPWTVVMVSVLTIGVGVPERLLGLDPLDALVDAAMAGLISFVVLEYSKG